MTIEVHRQINQAVERIGERAARTICLIVNREEGQDMIEYALLAALISIVAIAIILLIGPYLDKLFQDVINAVNSA